MTMSIAEVHAALTAPGQMFEMDEVEIRGVPTRVWKNAPPTLREVLVAASRRPQRPEVLDEIFRARRWSSNRRVRRALALNPYSAPALASAALALLTAPDLREVAGDLTISSDVRVQARRLLGARNAETD